MMKPDRSNYEIFLLDWLEGNLDPHDEEEIRRFLSENPDLRDESEPLTLIRLNPEKVSFPCREKIMKSAADLTASQFDILAVAGLENDLSPDQVADLQEAVDKSPENRKAYEVIRKLRLLPPRVNYPHKSALRKKGPAGKMIRLVVTSLSTAALVFFLFRIFFVIPGAMRGETVNITSSYISDTVDIELIPPFISTNASESSLKPDAGIKSVALSDSPKEEAVPQNAETGPAPEAISSRGMPVERTNLQTIFIPESMALTGLNTQAGQDNLLMAFNSEIRGNSFDDMRSNVEKFAARFFHERIMRNKEAGDSPVKAYDVAEAGIKGMNKLFGTELALVKNTDSKGEVVSIYFSSKSLRFNAPVKLSEPPM